ncbi:MAG: HDOD domain-containing protein [Fibrobacterales bacterium]
MKNQIIEDRIGGIEELPTLPLVIRQVQKVMRDPNSNMANIASIITKDQSLSTKVLRLVNSAHYGLRSRVTSVSQAIVILGLNTVNNIMLGLSVINMFDEKSDSLFNYDKFWEHSFGCALMAKHLSATMNYPDPEICFITGLLHDIGKLIQEQFMHKDFVKCLTLTHTTKKPLIENEENVFGFNHSDLGAYITNKWEIPENICIAIQYHHNPQDLPPNLEEHRDIVNILAAANQLCQLEGLGDQSEEYKPVFGEVLPIEIPQEKLDEIIEKTKEEIKITLKEWHA